MTVSGACESTTKGKRKMPTKEKEGGGPRRMLTIDEVLQIVPVTRGTIYNMEKQGRFPKSHYISDNRRVWFEDEIVAWQESVGGDDDPKPRGRHIRRRKRKS
jgi:prophage regulatory protein